MDKTKHPFLASFYFLFLIFHKLEYIIIIGLRTMMCNREDFTDMEAFGEQREEWLRKFLELPHGIPDSDTFRRVFERINPEALAECLYDWLGCHWEKNTVAAIVGKTIRGGKSKSHKAYHVVSALAAKNKLVLGELVTEENPMKLPPFQIFWIPLTWWGVS